jgi:iron complex outermembrane receptor protein
VNIDVVYFNSSTKNEVLSYEDENFPNQIFYNNAGKSKRSGFEISSLIRINESINIETSYSVGKYIFDDFIDKGNNYSGNKIPGVPNKILTLGLEYITKSELFINLNLKSIGNIYADNSNSVKISKSKTINFKIGKELKFNKIKINPFLTINNVFGNNYFDNIRINAFGGRHYEPAPKRIIFGGVKIIL